MKNVLYLDYFFPPLEADWRGIAFAKYLPEFGWNPTVISADESVRYGKDYTLLNELPQSLRVFRLGHREPSRIARTLRRRLRMKSDFPDEYKGWYGPAHSVAREILQREKFDLIYSASPTFTTALVAMQLKREFKIPWIADFLDGWAVNEFFKLECEKTIIQPLRWFYETRVRRAERSILSSADRTVVISWDVKRKLVDLHEGLDDRVEVITDGYDEHTFRGVTESHLFPGRLCIVFLGSYYTPFREPIIRFLDVVNELQPGAEVVFVGRAAVPVHVLNVRTRNATCIMHVPRMKALSFGAGSDFLFVVMPRFAKWIPTKIYDYLRLGKPVLALVPEDGDAARIIRESNAGFVLSYDVGKMRQQLGSIFERWKQGDFENFKPDQAYVKQFERRRLTERMARVFDDIAG